MNPQVSASLNKGKSSIALVNTLIYIVFDKYDVDCIDIKHIVS